MAAAHYIIFHPDKKRVQVKVKAVALTQTSVNPGWSGDVWVDKPNGNEDPFVLVEPWVFSYCHATQLRRERRHSSYIQSGSYLVFCSGDAADDYMLQIDTIFVVGRVAEWQWGKRVGLPVEFKQHDHNNSSILWMRHLEYGMGKQHKGRYTCLSCGWHHGATQFSFLPLDAAGQRAEFPINQLPHAVPALVMHGVKGKMPVLLDDQQVEAVLNLVEECTATKVVKDIEPIEKTELSGKVTLHCC